MCLQNVRRWLQGELFDYMDVSVLTSSKDHEKLDARVVITSYDLMSRLVDELGDRARGFRVLIMVRPVSASTHFVAMLAIRIVRICILH